MMRAFCAALIMAAANSSAHAADANTSTHRYLIERTFPAGAIDGVDAAAKHKVNANNQALGVNWEKSYANAEKTKTYCIYTGPSEAAVRDAARLNGLPVDVVTDISTDIKAEPKGAVQRIDAGQHRYLVKRAVRVDRGDSGDCVSVLVRMGTFTVFWETETGLRMAAGSGGLSNAISRARFKNCRSGNSWRPGHFTQEQRQSLASLLLSQAGATSPV
jgi:hypothetical protein